MRIIKRHFRFEVGPCPFRTGRSVAQPQDGTLETTLKMRDNKGPARLVRADPLRWPCISARECLFLGGCGLKSSAFFPLRGKDSNGHSYLRSGNDERCGGRSETQSAFGLGRRGCPAL